MENIKKIEEAKAALGLRLEQLRISKKKSKYVVEKKAGLSFKQINDLESGSSNYTIDSLLKYLMVIDENVIKNDNLSI